MQHYAGPYAAPMQYRGSGAMQVYAATPLASFTRIVYVLKMKTMCHAHMCDRHVTSRSSCPRAFTAC